MKTELRVDNGAGGICCPFCGMYSYKAITSVYDQEAQSSIEAVEFHGRCIHAMGFMPIISPLGNMSVFLFQEELTANISLPLLEKSVPS